MVRGSGIWTATKSGCHSNQVQLAPRRLLLCLLAQRQGSSYEFCVAELAEVAGMQWGGDLVEGREYEQDVTKINF
jgi:hypothetical protein